MSLTYVKTSCHCSLNTFQSTFDTSTLPQATGMCHCNLCRHSSGKLALNAAILAGAPLSVDSTADTVQHPANLSKFTTYNAVKLNLTRYFCPRCGAFMLSELKLGTQTMWMVSTGVLERTVGIAKLGYHAFVADTRDGGLAEHYKTVNGAQIPQYVKYGGGETMPIVWNTDKSEKASTNERALSEEHLQAYCQCRTIQVHVTRSTSAQGIDASQRGLVPAAATELTVRTRFMAEHDVCTTCRLTGGSLFTSWATVPRTNVIDNRTGYPVSFLEGSKKSEDSKRIPGLMQYQSSPGTFREFCSTCGATAFLWSQDNNAPEAIVEEPRTINIGVGLFDEKDDRARVESWLLWSPRISNAADALDTSGRDAVQVMLDQSTYF